MAARRCLGSRCPEGQVQSRRSAPGPASNRLPAMAGRPGDPFESDQARLGVAVDAYAWITTPVRMARASGWGTATESARLIASIRHGCGGAVDLDGAVVTFPRG